MVVLDKLDYCASLRNLESVNGSSNYKVCPGPYTKMLQPNKQELGADPVAALSS